MTVGALVVNVILAESVTYSDERNPSDVGWSLVTLACCLCNPRVNICPNYYSRPTMEPH